MRCPLTLAEASGNLATLRRAPNNRVAAIPVAERMLAEAFDVLTDGREYQAAASVPNALPRTERASGSPF